MKAEFFGFILTGIAGNWQRFMSEIHSGTQVVQNASVQTMRWNCK